MAEPDDEVKEMIAKKMKEVEGKGFQGSSAPAGEYKELELTDANFDKVLAGEKLMLVDFWAPWCGPCRWVTPILEEIARENAGRLVLGKMNTDENPRIPSRFGIEGIPTILISKNGQIADRIVGAAPKETLMARIRPHLQ